VTGTAAGGASAEGPDQDPEPEVDPATVPTIGTGAAADASDLVVETPHGKLRGSRTGAVGSWLGVPYAAPPVGRRRFDAAEVPEPWLGVRDARTYGPVASQPGLLRLPARLARLSRGGQSEDCLTLNVWAPADLDTSGTGGRPVLFWIHGGAYETGAGSLYSGAELAERGDIVVVTVNYRLGAFGFVDLTDLFDDERFAANAGLTDQIAALTWVRDSIAAFGGDPARVTIAGESAGAGSVSALLVAPAVRGLFAGAISQSGGLNQVCDREHALETAELFARQLHVSRENRDQLFDLDPSRLITAMTAVRRARVEKFSTRPYFDGRVLPASREEARAHQSPPVPLLSGTNRDEVTMFHALRQKIMPMSRVVVTNAMTPQLGGDAVDAILNCYPDNRAGLVRLGTDLAFEAPSREFAEAHAVRAPVWRYRFDFASPLLAGRIGATHGLELWFLFDIAAPLRSRRALLGKDRDAIAALSDRMKSAWIGFVRNGDPGQDWARYEVTGPVERQRSTRIFDVVDREELDPERDRRLVWQPFTPTIP